jgi:hypothetical protein
MLAVPVALASGVYNVQATVTDNAGSTANDATTNELTVDIGIPAVVLTTPTLPQKGNVPIAYTLSDAESDLCSIQVQFSRDGGLTWRAATAGPGGDGVTGLTSSPAGTAHTFVWNSAADVGANAIVDNVGIRITPSDPLGPGAVQSTGSFTVNYRDLAGTLGTPWTLPASVVVGAPVAGTVTVVVTNVGNVAPAHGRDDAFGGAAIIAGEVENVTTVTNVKFLDNQYVGTFTQAPGGAISNARSRIAGSMASGPAAVRRGLSTAQAALRQVAGCCQNLVVHAIERAFGLELL